jgi:tetratricopeptide (TPR) repeat protein
VITPESLGASVPLCVVALVAASLCAQEPSAECPTSPCAETSRTTSPAQAQLWRDASSIHEIKLQFVDAFQRFVRAQAGTFGDEGGELTNAVAAMRESLSRWDQSIAQLQTRVRRTPREAEAHVMLATVWLDRHRLQQALDELRAAEFVATDRADVYRLRALALAALDRTPEAASAIGRASALEPDNPASRYLLARYRAQPQRADSTADAWREVARVVQRARSGARSDANGFAPFERVGLLRQSSGIAPIFLQSRYSAAMQAIRAGDYGAAVATLGEAIAADPIVASPAAVRARLGAAAALLRAGRIESALEQLLSARDEWPDEPEIHRLLGVIYRIDEQQGKSIDHLRKAMTLAPGDERARVMLVDALIDERRASEAERELKAASAASGQIAYRLSQLYQRQSLLPQATAALQESERFGPVIGADYFFQSWAALLVNQADFGRAISIDLRRIEANPNSGEAHRQLGEIFILQGRDDEALAELLVAAWLDPKDARAHAAAGQVYARMMKYPDAIDALTRAVTLDPRLREARYTLGTVLMRVGKVDEGKRELETFGAQQADAEAQGQREFEIDALRRRAAAHARDGDVAGAIDGFERAAMLDPGSSRSHRDLGVVLLRGRRVGEAIEHLQRAQQIEETTDGFAHLVDAYAAIGNEDESARMRTAYQESLRRAKADRIRELVR